MLNFFNKKNIITCIVQCDKRNIIYGTDDNGNTKSTFEFVFRFINPERLNLLYKYEDVSTEYEVGKQYKIKYNLDDSSFVILKAI